ncbi:hypothetical protein TNCV_4533141 [Trichonephila clavipes]|nr:hypothetical protein TNCV_4533141 [Trichonephila clavipes]
MPITRVMEEQLNTLLESVNALKSGQKDMQKSQGENGEYAEETKNELKEGMQKGLEDMQRSQEETKMS